MNNPPPIPGRHPRRLWKIPLIIGVLLLPFVVLLAAFVWIRVSNGNEVRRLEANVRKAGQPLTLAELAKALPTVPDNENAALPMMKLWSDEDPEFWAAFQIKVQPLPERRPAEIDPAVPYLGSAKLIPGQPPTPESMAAASDYLQKRSEHMQRVRAALERPRFSFPLPVQEGMAMLLPHLSELRNEARNFSLEALVATEMGDHASALAALEHTAGVGHWLAEEPLLISQLVRAACYGLVLENSERMLSRAQLTDAELLRLQKTLEGLEMTNSLRTTLITERAFGYSLYSTSEGPQILAQSSGNSADVRKMRTGLRVLSAIGLTAPDQKLLLKTIEQAVAASEKNYPESVIELNALFDSALAKSKKFPPKIFTGMLLPSVAKAGERMARFEAARRTALMGVAVERYRLANRRLPTALEALVPKFMPEVYADPFDGKPLRFDTAGNRYVVYSIGEDFEDNAGTEPASGSKSRDGADVCFSVERSTARNSKAN